MTIARGLELSMELGCSVGFCRVQVDRICHLDNRAGSGRQLSPGDLARSLSRTVRDGLIMRARHGVTLSHSHSGILKRLGVVDDTPGLCGDVVTSYGCSVCAWLGVDLQPPLEEARRQWRSAERELRRAGAEVDWIAHDPPANASENEWREADELRAQVAKEVGLDDLREAANCARDTVKEMEVGL